MKKEVRTDKAPLPIGPYSQAVRVGDFVFVSGQIAPEEEDIEKQTEKILQNIANILGKENISLDNVVRVDVYIKDLSLFENFNKAYKKFFNPPYPARVTVEVSGLPKDALVEISVIASL